METVANASQTQEWRGAAVRIRPHVRTALESVRVAIEELPPAVSDAYALALTNALSDAHVHLLGAQNVVEHLVGEMGRLPRPQYPQGARASAPLLQCPGCNDKLEIDQPCAACGWSPPPLPAGPLEAGLHVLVFEDPITRTRPEGKAELVQLLRTNPQDHTETWEVRFRDGPDRDVKYRRTIRVAPDQLSP